MEEPNALIRGTIFIFGGGDIAFWGALVIAVALGLSLRLGKSQSTRPVALIRDVAIGLILVGCGSPPLPIWFQIATFALLALVLNELRLRPSTSTSGSGFSVQPPRMSQRNFLFFSSFVWLLTAAAIELPFHIWSAPTGSISQILVIGDSVTAGLNDGEDTWPKQLSRTAEVKILDASQPGATLQSARQQNSLLSGLTGLIVLEIGGNDMLEGLPVKRFEEDLERLLTEVAQPGRLIVMFELPLPPLCAGYGAAQRELARRFHVSLIPKRRFCQVLTSKGATVDGIHLSARGQTQMMQLIQSLLGNRLPMGSGTYQRLERR